MKNSPLVRTPLQLARTSWQTSAYLTTQMPVQALTSSASQTLDSKPTEPWVNSNTLRCNTSFEATPMLKLRKRLVSVLFAKFSFYAWITDGKQRRLIQGGGICRLLFTEACRQVNMALIWYTRTKLTILLMWSMWLFNWLWETVCLINRNSIYFRALLL